MDENNVLLENTILSLIENRKFASLKDVLISMNSVDIAALLENTDKELLPKIFRMLPKGLAADTFVEMEADFQELLIECFSDKELKAVINELYADDAVDIIEEMPANVVSRILKQASSDMRKEINELLKYPEDSAGSVMTTEFVNFRSSITINAALDIIHRTGIDKETVNTCYVTENSRKLIGLVTLRSLVIGNPEQEISEIMQTNVIKVTTDTDKETVANLLKKYDLIALPVVDNEDRLVGIITVDDAIDVIEEEATEDIEKMAAILPTDKPYLKLGILETVKKRIPWLLLLMISATFTGLIISSFEEKLKLCPALIAFIPMIMGTGGNSGGQSSVTVIRGLSLGEIEFRDIFKVVFKELRVALICGGILAVVNFIKIIVFDMWILGGSGISSMLENLVISLTLLATVTIAKIVGSILPMLAEKIGLDPAVMASPFITTIVDAISLLIYFGVATILII